MSGEGKILREALSGYANNDSFNTFKHDVNYNELKKAIDELILPDGWKLYVHKSKYPNIWSFGWFNYSQEDDPENISLIYAKHQGVKIYSVYDSKSNRSQATKGLDHSVEVIQKIIDEWDDQNHKRNVKMRESLAPDINLNIFNSILAKATKMKEVLEVQSNRGSRDAKALLNAMSSFMDQVRAIQARLS
jgi:CRISPR/Cas system CSM-associated protein Csm2 small subunit